MAETLTTKWKVFEDEPTYSNGVFCKSINQIITHETEKTIWTENEESKIEVNSEGEIILKSGSHWIYVKGEKFLNLLSEAIEIARKNNIEIPEVQVFEK